MESYQVVDNCIEKCGGSNGRFQKTFITLLCLIFGVQNLFLYGFGFFELIPKLNCEEIGVPGPKSCSRDDACKSNGGYTINFNDPSTLQNWVTQYDLVCNSKQTLALLGALLLAGLFAGSVFLVRLGDIFGRKRVIIVMVSCSTLLLVGIVLVQNIVALCVLVFLFGMSASPRYALTFVYCLELTTKKHEAFYSTLALTFGSSGLVILGVFFYFVKDMKIIIYILIGIQSVLIVVVALFVPESPKYLYEKGELVKFRKAMQTIARFNGKHIDIEEIQALESQILDQEIEEVTPPNNNNENRFINMTYSDEGVTQRTSEKVKKVQANFKLFYKDKVHLKNTISLSLLWAISCYAFYFTEFYMKYVPVDNLYLLAVLMGAADIFSGVIFKILINYISGKAILRLCFLALGAMSLTLSLILWLQHEPSKLFVLITILTFGMRFFSAIAFTVCYYANNQYFPPLLKAGIFTITNIAARAATIFAPLVAEWVANPCITVTATAVVAFFSIGLLQNHQNIEKDDNYK